MPGLSNWREEFNLSEVVTGKMTDKEALKKVSEKSNINNKVTINPKLDEAVKEIGGEVIGMVEQDTTAQKQRIDMKQMILDRQKLKLRRKDLSAAKKEKKEGEEGESTNATKQANVIAQEETVKQVNEKKRKNALQIQKIVGESAVLDANTKIGNKEKRDKLKKELDTLTKRAKAMKKHGSSYHPFLHDEEVELDERLGGKGYQPYTNLRGEKISGDWEDSDRGKGNKAKKRAGGKVEKKSPTYRAHVLNKEEVVVDEGVYERRKTKEVIAALKRDKRNLPYTTKASIARRIVSDKGDTSKSDDRYAYEETILEKDLNAAERRALPDKDFALPGKGKGPEGKQAGSYPIPDEKHARSALSLVAQHGTPEEKATVRAKVKKKFPNIEVNEGVMKFVKSIGKKKKVEKKPSMDSITTKVHQWRKDREKEERRKYVSDFDPIDEAKVDQGRSDYGKATIRNYRRSGPGHGEPAMFDPENKRGKLIDKRREEHKARRGVKGSKVPAYKVSEDKAFNFVVNKLKSKYGDGVLTKGDKMPELSAAQKKKNAEIRAKRAKEDHRDPTEKASDGRYSDRYSNRGSD